jgi:hypothetical protein
MQFVTLLPGPALLLVQIFEVTLFQQDHFAQNGMQTCMHRAGLAPWDRASVIGLSSGPAPYPMG